MSGSNMMDGAVTVFTNASAFGPSHISKDYGVLEHSSCAIVVQPVANVSTPRAYGNLRRQDRTLLLDLWIPDTGNVNADMVKMTQFEDTVFNVLLADQSLSSTACGMEEIRQRRDVDAVFIYGGQQWFRSRTEVDLWET